MPNNVPAQHLLRGLLSAGRAELRRCGAELELYADRTPYYTNWGFTLYRTCYKPSSDSSWEKLLDDICTQAKSNLSSLDGLTEPGGDALFEKLWSLFRLDARSDPAMEGLDMDAVRQLWKTDETFHEDARSLATRYTNSQENPPMNADGRCQTRLFLLADEEVLDGVVPGTVKVVEVDYEDANYANPVNTRYGPQGYFGWMRMLTGAVMDLWKELEDNNLDNIAPRTIGGQVVTWVGEEHWLWESMNARKASIERNLGEMKLHD